MKYEYSYTSFETLLHELEDNSVMLLAGREAYFNQNRKSIYEITENICQGHFGLNDPIEFDKFFRIDHNRHNYYRAYKTLLSRMKDFNPSVYHIADIPFSIYLSFDDNYFINEIFNQRGCKFEEWAFSKRETISDFIKNINISKLPKVITFPINGELTNYPIITKNDLIYLAQFVLKNLDLIDEIFYLYRKIKTVVVIGVKIDKGHSGAFDYLYNRWFFDSYETINSSLFEYMLKKQIEQSMVYSPFSGYIKSRDELFFEFYTGGKRIIFVPVSNTCDFLDELHERCSSLINLKEHARTVEKHLDEEVKRLIASNEIHKAVELLSNKTEEKNKKIELIEIRGRLEQIHTDNIRGLLHYDDYIRHKNAIRNDLLNLIFN